MYFEDFVIGKQALTPERRIAVTHLDAFLDISGLHLPMFLSDEGAQRFGHEKRLVPGPMILSIAMGLANILFKHDTEADVDRLKNWDTEAVPILLFQTPLAFL